MDRNILKDLLLNDVISLIFNEKMLFEESSRKLYESWHSIKQRVFMQHAINFAVEIKKSLSDIYDYEFPAPEVYKYVTINSRQINHFYGASFTFCNIVNERPSEFMLS